MLREIEREKECKPFIDFTQIHKDGFNFFKNRNEYNKYFNIRKRTRHNRQNGQNESINNNMVYPSSKISK